MFNHGLKTELSVDIKDRIVQHKSNFYYIFTNRYFELLPSLIKYEHSDNPIIQINFLQLEHALRQGHAIAVGLNNEGNLVILGYINKKQEISNLEFLTPRRLTETDIRFTIPKNLRLDTYLELSQHDGYETGNFVIFKNKEINLLNDFRIIEHYANEISEIVVSRFSLSIQAKVLTFFISNEAGNETINQLVSDVYNGSPYVKVDKFFDADENIIQINNAGLAQNFTELKREYQNKLSELNTMLGIQNLGVDKDSGVSNIESKSSESFTNSNANIYLASRDISLRALNSHFNLDIQALYNNSVSSELENLTKLGEFNENNNNIT